MEKTYRASMPRKEGEAWVKALRSGKYQQGKGALKRLYQNGPAHCCIGVFCEVNGIKLVSDSSGTFYNDMVNSSDNKPNSYTPFIEIVGSYITDTLWKMNDEDGKSFAEIADWIEANIEFV